MNIALILSGGTGIRMGLDLPKQYVKVEGKAIIFYSLKTLLSHDRIDAVQIVAEAVWQENIRQWVQEFDENVIREKWKGFSLPGENRQLSICHGLKDMASFAKDSDYVLIHDAARPLLSKKQITDCLDGAAGHDGAMPVLPMKDTVYSSADGKKVGALLNRREIYAGQAPEVFQFGAYYKANLQLLPERILEINGSTEPAILAGLDIAMIPGDEENFKITTKADLDRFRDIMKERVKETQ
ncbi:MAG: 2-C-methyl-D-erythritol 4-phosphate cytidylyltransferase [Lachnospiraceae bacterium]|jgi:2-C-methyl-D-erythritol 4-phosphate cytidylyltransferase|nr:2-C-methyl-D-erythritol 4-phosphate cytidylyltransferase [Lachnospiraceae bacterium]